MANSEEKDGFLINSEEKGEGKSFMRGRSMYARGLSLDEPGLREIFDSAIDEYKRMIANSLETEENSLNFAKEKKSFMDFFWQGNKSYVLFEEVDNKNLYEWEKLIKRDSVDAFANRHFELLKHLKKKKEEGIAFDGEEEIIDAYFEMLEIMELEGRGYKVIDHLMKENPEGVLKIFRTLMSQRMAAITPFESSDFERKFLRRMKLEEEIRGNKDWVEACGEDFYRWLEEEANSIMKELLDENPESIDYNLNYQGSFYYKFFKEKGHPDLSNLNAKYRKFLERAAALRAIGTNAATEVKNVYAYLVLVEDLKKIWLTSPAGIKVDEEGMKKLHEKYLYLKKLGIPFEKRSNLEKIFDHMMKSYGFSLPKSN